MGMVMNTNLNNTVKRKIMGAERLAREINLYYAYMNHHLDLLNFAIREKNITEQEFQKERLKCIRSILMELEYFNMRGE